MARKSTIGAPPRDAAVQARTGGTKRAEPARARKERVTFQLPVGLIEKARDVVFFSPGLTMASFMDQLKRVEKKRGEPFPSRRCSQDRKAAKA